MGNNPIPPAGARLAPTPVRPVLRVVAVVWVLLGLGLFALMGPTTPGFLVLGGAVWLAALLTLPVRRAMLDMIDVWTRWLRALGFISPPPLSREDSRIAGYEQEYVNGTLDLDGLERAISGVLGLPIPPTVEELAAAREEARERRDGVLLKAPPKPTDALRSVTPAPGRDGLGRSVPIVGGNGCIIATHSSTWSGGANTDSIPATAVGPAPSREVVELVDGSGEHVAYVDVTPRNRPSQFPRPRMQEIGKEPLPTEPDPRLVDRRPHG